MLPAVCAENQKLLDAIDELLEGWEATQGTCAAARQIVYNYPKPLTGKQRKLVEIGLREAYTILQTGWNQVEVELANLPEVEISDEAERKSPLGRLGRLIGQRGRKADSTTCGKRHRLSG